MAQLDKTTLISNLDANINTNGNQLITGAIHNAFLHDMIDSIPNLIDDVNALGTKEYDGTITYDKGDTTMFEGILYQALSNGLTGTFAPASWEKIAGQSTAWQDPVIDILTAPPGGESEGDRYLIDNGASGTWNNKDGQIAEFRDSTWRYTSPEDGWKITVNDEDDGFYHHEGAYSIGVFAWVKQFSDLNGSGTAGKIVKWIDSNTMGNSILSESGTVITANGGFSVTSATNTSALNDVSGGALISYLGSDNIFITTDNGVGATPNIYLDGPNDEIYLAVDNLASNRITLKGDVAASVAGAIIVKINTVNAAASSASNDYPAVIIGSKNSSFDPGILDSVIAAGIGVHADKNSYLFTQNFEVQGGAMNVTGVNGINYVPGSDVDVDIASIIVTGNPRFYWYQTGGAFTIQTSTTARLTLRTNSGQDSMLSFYEGATEMSRLMWDGGTDTWKFIVGGGTGSPVMEMLTDGEIRIYNEGETNPTVQTDSISYWVSDANGAGTCSLFLKTEDDITIVLAETSLMTNLTLSGVLETPKTKDTLLGGRAIKLTNKTGGNTVQGQLVIASTGTVDAFATAGASDDDVIGIVLDAGIADGSEAWVVVQGIADVLIDAGGAALGDRMISSATAGSADVNNAPATAVHFQEIGHAIESIGGAGLARCVLHFN